jgi:nitrite reductase (NADH) large subunit
MTSPRLHVLQRAPRQVAVWRSARVVALATLAVLLVALVLTPDVALAALWYVAVPLLPATFFLNPVLWRGVCPLATANELGNRLARGREPSARAVMQLSITGVLLFHLLVPARRFLFNVEGLALAATIVAVALLAIGLGAVFEVRAGFCNGLCPVLPVELLYGQSPLLTLQRGRCTACTVCTPRGCLDLSQGKALQQMLGPDRRSGRWLFTPFGLFIASMPGFIVGYSVTNDGPIAAAPMVYATTLGWSAASVAVVAAALHLVRVPSRVVLPLIAAVGGWLYYWFAGPAVARQVEAPDALSVAVRVAGMALVTLWLGRALARRGMATG